MNLKTENPTGVRVSTMCGFLGCASVRIYDTQSSRYVGSILYSSKLSLIKLHNPKFPLSIIVYRNRRRCELYPKVWRRFDPPRDIMQPLLTDNRKPLWPSPFLSSRPESVCYRYSHPTLLCSSPIHGRSVERNIFDLNWIILFVVLNKQGPIYYVCVPTRESLLTRNCYSQS